MSWSEYSTQTRINKKYPTHLPPNSPSQILAGPFRRAAFSLFPFPATGIFRVSLTRERHKALTTRQRAHKTGMPCAPQGLQLRPGGSSCTRPGAQAEDRQNPSSSAAFRAHGGRASGTGSGQGSTGSTAAGSVSGYRRTPALHTRGLNGATTDPREQRNGPGIAVVKQRNCVVKQQTCLEAGLRQGDIFRETGSAGGKCASRSAQNLVTLRRKWGVCADFRSNCAAKISSPPARGASGGTMGGVGRCCWEV